VISHCKGGKKATLGINAVGGKGEQCVHGRTNREVEGMGEKDHKESRGRLGLKDYGREEYVREGKRKIRRLQIIPEKKSMKTKKGGSQGGDGILQIKKKIVKRKAEKKKDEQITGISENKRGRTIDIELGGFGQK